MEKLEPILLACGRVPLAALLSIYLTTLAMSSGEPTTPNVLLNGEFKHGLQNWKSTGEIDHTHGVSLGPSPSSVSQRYIVPGLRILLFSANVRLTSKAILAKLRLKCFDKRGRVLMDLTSDVDPKKGVEPSGTTSAIYLKTHAFTSYIIVSVEVSGSEGRAAVDWMKLEDDDRNRIEHAPEIDLDAYMKPVWETETITDESVLLFSHGGAVPTGRLLYEPTKILSVMNCNLNVHYRQKEDFEINGRTISATPGSPIPTMGDGDLAKGEFPWTDLTGHHVFVTYRHQDRLNLPIPQYQGAVLPETMRRLLEHQALKIAAYGDSITLGINVSGYRNVPPYTPPWPTLAERQLQKDFGDPRIKLYNMGLGGMTSEWAKDNARDAVASLHPDLVLIAFGMNDFWSLTLDLFKTNIKATIDQIRKKNSRTEFILIAPLKFDPAYTTDRTYVGNLAGYKDALKDLTGPGIALFDMTSLSQALYDVKSAKDLEADPMHPDDFLARIYAQGIVALLTDPTSKDSK